MNGPDFDEFEDDSGMMDYERQRWEEEQEILRADPGYTEWLNSIDELYEQEKDDGDYSF